MQKNKLKLLCYGTVAVAGVGFFGYLFMRYLLVLLLPFMIAWCVGMAVRRPASFFSQKTHIPVKLWRLLLTALLISGVLVPVGLGVYRLSLELWHFLERIGSGEGSIPGLSILDRNGLLGGLLSGLGEQVRDGVYQLLVKLLGSLAALLSGVLSSVPKILLGSLVTVIASVYFALDVDKINSTLAELIPKGARRFTDKFKNGFLAVGVKYLRSYLILMGITFGVVLVGFLILRVPYAVLLSLAVSVLDILPVIGVGTVLIPWSVVELIRGNTALALGLLAVYGANLVIRQLTEPKIIGKHLGVHPILTLLLLYIGYSLFGFTGILFVPLATVLIQLLLNKEDSAKVDQSASAETDGG